MEQVTRIYILLAAAATLSHTLASKSSFLSFFSPVAFIVYVGHNEKNINYRLINSVLLMQSFFTVVYFVAYCYHVRTGLS